ncbi:2-aminoethylphosphonate--pyruvate transaminase [Aquirhabdus sp.]|uniref:2-aminoethylphosphonate--pyruvate transaminase n=1 Tax=Aquirhabdus sp. TaxID=2824160 RepID=UPI00396CDCA7
MAILDLPAHPYLLLTPGPLSTSATVKAAMLRDWCTWDAEYNNLIQDIRTRLVALATANTTDYTAVLMQGSGSFSVESVLGSVVPHSGRLLIIANGAYGERMVQMATRMQIAISVLRVSELDRPTPELVAERLLQESDITHVACVHCETTTGMLNPVQEIGSVVKDAGKIWIVDAMSSFAGLPIDVADWDIDFLISSANKCIQGVPGFGFVISKRKTLLECAGIARSVSLDLFDQWQTMEQQNGKWRFTSPTHVVHAFYQAMLELEQEGGITARHARYQENQRLLVDGMLALGFKLVVENLAWHSPIITTFRYPQIENFSFSHLYEQLKTHGFVIYPGKVTDLDCFRIGNIGEVYPADIKLLLMAMKDVCIDFNMEPISA